MPTVTLMTKVYDNFQLKFVSQFLKSTFKDLKVEIKICEVAPRGRVQIAVSGEDEKVALNYLADKIGLCPVHLQHINKYSQIKGSITSLNKSRNELYIDVGVFSPTIVDAIIPLHSLQSQLTEGRKVALKKIAELFGFCENLPLTVKILDVNKEKSRIEAIFSKMQIIRYRNWTKSLLDRLIILGASLYDVRVALKMAKCNRDVISIEPLGLFEYAIVCKLGTDAAGLIPKIGKNLRSVALTTFNPRKIIAFLGDSLV